VEAAATRVAELSAALAKRKDDLSGKEAENRIWKARIDEVQASLDEGLQEVDLCRRALVFLDSLALSCRRPVKEKIEKVLTEGVRLIYGSDYSVELDYSTKAGRSNLDVALLRETQQGLVRRTKGFSGGMSDTLSVPLRLLVLLGSKQTDRIVVLDECYKHMDLGRIESVASFLDTVSKQLQTQIIFLSHHEIMRDYADGVWEVVDNRGQTTIVRAV